MGRARIRPGVAAVGMTVVVVIGAAIAGSPDAPSLETLLKADLERVEGTEVVVSRVTLPPRTTLPRHWHPGEEFAYVVEGSVTLWQEGREELRLTKPGMFWFSVPRPYPIQAPRLGRSRRRSPVCSCKNDWA